MSCTARGVLCLLLLAGLEGLCFPAAAAATVAFIADLRGDVKLDSESRPLLMSELAEGQKLSLTKDASAVVMFIRSGDEYPLKGPGEYQIGSGAISALHGSPPARRATGWRPDLSKVVEVSKSATASLRMRGAKPLAAESPEPAFGPLYPVDTYVATLQPTFSWAKDKSAKQYTLVVGANGKEIYRTRLEATALKIPIRLTPATHYDWAVTAGERNFAAVKFSTLGEEDLKRVEALKPRVREVKFADGSIYRGGVRGTALHGSGEFVSKNGFRYQGDFKEGKKQGKGTYSWTNGDSYEGEFADDKPSGKGAYKFSNGDRYEGEVQNGTISGKGVYVTKAGDQIEGAFVDGKANGKGLYRFASGDRYEGQILQGRLTGKGIYFSANGDQIEGQFVDGRPQAGIYRFSNGDRYEGELQSGALTGRGTYFYSSGLRYEGDLIQGKPNGAGTFWFNDGTRFERTFEDGLKKAKGQLVTQGGARQGAEIIEGTVRITGN